VLRWAERPSCPIGTNSPIDPHGLVGADGPGNRAGHGDQAADEKEGGGAANTPARSATITRGVKAMAAKKRQSVDNAAAQRLNVRITSEAYERLLVHAIKSRVSPGELVTSLIERNLRDYRVQDVRVKANDRLEISDQASESESKAA